MTQEIPRDINGIINQYLGFWLKIEFSIMKNSMVLFEEPVTFSLLEVK